MKSRVQQLISRIENKCNEGIYLFRGEVQKFATPTSSSLFRFHQDIMGDALNSIPQVSKELIKNAKHHFENDLSDFEILASLQHYGGKTPLVDFSRNILIALFFACNDKFNETGYVFILDEKKISKKGKKEANLKDLFYSIYESSNKSNRFIFQSSVFVYSRFGYIEPSLYDIIKISPDLKLEVLSHLDRFHNINENTIYNDIFGFISNPENFETTDTLFEKGFNERFNKRFEKAISYFTRVIIKNGGPIETNRSYIQRSICYLEIKEAELALNDINTALSEPGYSSASALLIRADVYFKGFNDTNKALEECNKALQCATYDKYRVFEKKAEIYHYQSKLRFTKASELTKEEFRVWKSELKTKAIKEYSNSIDNYVNGSVIPSPLPSLYRMRAKIFKEIGNIEKATSDLLKSKEFIK